MPKSINTGHLAGNRSLAETVAASDQWMHALGRRVRFVGDCWVVGPNEQKYVMVGLGDGRGVDRAHRMVYRTFHPDEDIDGMHIHHQCHRPACINPDHLVSLTPDEHRREHAQRSA